MTLPTEPAAGTLLIDGQPAIVAGDGCGCVDHDCVDHFQYVELISGGVDHRCFRVVAYNATGIG